MSAAPEPPRVPRKVQVRKGAHNASQAIADRLARGLPRWAARLVRKAVRQPARPKKPAPPGEQNLTHFHYHAD